MWKISVIGCGRVTVGDKWYIAPINGVCRVHIIHRGEATVRLSNITRTLKEGYIYVLPQNLAFEPESIPSEIMDHTYFDFFSLPTIISQDAIEIDPRRYPLIASAAAVLTELAPKKEVGYRALKVAYLSNFLDIVNMQIKLDLLRDEVIKDAVEYIHENFYKKISVLDLAEKYHLEENVFIRKFKRHIGTTPYQYIKNHRINSAVALIKENKYSLSEIAEMSGYCDQTALSHAVKSAYGLYPNKISKL